MANYNIVEVADLKTNFGNISSTEKLPTRTAQHESTDNT